MAIDMTTVKQIMHNNKEVVKIEDGLGKVLWQKQAEPEWHTIYDNNSGTQILKLGGTRNPYGRWILGSVPANISDKATKLRITYKQYVEYNATEGEGSGYTDNDNRWAKLVFDKGGNNITVSPAANTILTQEFDYTQGKDILYAYYYPERNYVNNVAQSRWYKNGLASVSIDNTDYWGITRIWYIVIYKVEEYY